MKYGKLAVVIVISTMMIFSGCNKETSGVESTESTIVNEKENSDESSLISERKHCVKVLLPEEMQVFDREIMYYGGGHGGEKGSHEKKIDKKVERMLPERIAFESLKKGYQKENGVVVYDNMYYTFYNSTVYKSEVEFDRNDIEGCGAVEVYKDPEYTRDDGNITDSGKKGYVKGEPSGMMYGFKG